MWSFFFSAQNRLQKNKKFFMGLLFGNETPEERKMMGVENGLYDMTEHLSSEKNKSTLFKFYWVEKKVLAAGSPPICREQLDFLKEQNIGLIISTTQHSLISEKMVENDEMAKIDPFVPQHLKDFRYLHFPTVDGQLVSENTARISMEAIKECFSRNKAVYIHSWSGRGRACDLCALYLMVFWSISGKTDEQNRTGVVGYLKHLESPKISFDLTRDRIEWLDVLEDSTMIQDLRETHNKNLKRVLIPPNK